MTAKEQKFIKESFKDGFFKVFDNNEDAQKMHDLLERNDVKHEFGDYLHTVEGKRRYNYGVRVLDTRKVQDLINSVTVDPDPEDNPVKDMEKLAGQTEPEKKPGDEPKEEAEEGTGTATRPVGVETPAENAENKTGKTAQKQDLAEKPAQKKKRNKKVNL